MTNPEPRTTPKQLWVFYEALEGVLMRHPDWRIGQAISNAASPVDVFYVENEALIRVLSEFESGDR